MMRWLLAVLVVVNLVLFLWGFTMSKQDKPVQKQFSPSVDVERIVLLREVETETQAVQEMPVPEPVAVIQSPEETPLPEISEAKAANEQEPAVLEGADAPVMEEETQVEEETAEISAAETAEEISETDPEVVEATGNMEPVSSEVCGRIGPFKTEQAAQQLGVELNLAEAEITREIVEEQKGYWVLIPAFPSRAEGQQMAEKLRAAGFNDLWLFNTGPMKNAISLGLFSRKENADMHSGVINQRGFDSEVRPKMVERPEFWLVYRDDAESVAAITLSTHVSNTKKPCNQASVAR